MTIETLREHEARALDMYKDDFRRTSLERLILPWVVGKRVLDMRCFRGELAVELAVRSFDVFALDGFSGAVEITNELARRRGINRPIAHLWELTGLAEKTGGHRFDTVLCVDVLNHVRDDRETIEAVWQVLVEDGRLILMAPAGPWLHGKRDEALGHVRRYKKESLKSLLEHNGFRLESIYYWNFLALPFYILSEKVLRKGVSDELRSGKIGAFRSLPNALLGWWYRIVENSLIFPYGLSLIVIARKGQYSEKSR